MRIEARAWARAAVIASAALAGAGSVAWADGAVAMGSTGDVVRDGIAFGSTVNEGKDQAPQTAIERCRSFEARAAAERCKVVATFNGQCFAVAYDPQPGTPGAGWGVGVDQLAANQKAVAMCEQAAGSARKGFCQVRSWGCDTMGQRGASFQAPQQEAANPDQKPTPEVAAPTPTSPANPALERPQAPVSKPPARRLEKDGSSWLGTHSPAFLVGVMVTVAAAYALSQLARGKLKGGVGERQVVLGGTLAVTSAAIVKLLELAGMGEGIVAVAAGILALAAAMFA
jgi:uncharacterized protein DUF4189